METLTVVDLDPQLDYKTALADAAVTEGDLPEGQAGIPTLYDPFRW